MRDAPKRDDTVTFRIPEEVSSWLHDRARSLGLKRSELCYRLVAEYLQSQTGTRTRDVDIANDCLERATELIGEAREHLMIMVVAGRKWNGQERRRTA